MWIDVPEEGEKEQRTEEEEDREEALGEEGSEESRVGIANWFDTLLKREKRNKQ